MTSRFVSCLTVVALAAAMSCGSESGFACGTTQCSSSDYCVVAPSDIAGDPTTYTCRALPASCGASPACACLAGVPCGTHCTAFGNNLTVTCPAG